MVQNFGMHMHLHNCFVIVLGFKTLGINILELHFVSIGKS